MTCLTGDSRERQSPTFYILLGEAEAANTVADDALGIIRRRRQARCVIAWPSRRVPSRANVSVVFVMLLSGCLVPPGSMRAVPFWNRAVSCARSPMK